MSDSRDWVKAAVAFSNSLPVGEPGIIFIGVYNDGRIEGKGISDSTLNKVSGELSNIYPLIAPQILARQKDGKDFIVVIIYGSPDKPHFAGQSYIRQGTQTLPASEKQFEELIAMRNSKAAQILKWKNRTITLDRLNSPQQTPMLGRLGSSQRKVVQECNEFYVTLDEVSATDNLESFPLRRIQLNFDHANKCLKLELDAV